MTGALVENSNILQTHPGADMKALQVLDASGNELKDMDGLTSYRELSSLILSCNQISSLSAVSHAFPLNHSYQSLGMNMSP